jgi:dipeptidyl aminopeptidase/acylaminoacyl peptidase
VVEVPVELVAESVEDSEVPLYPAISPDGRLVAYAVKTVATGNPAVSALWVADSDGGSAPRRVTDGTAWAGAPQWAPDSASLFFLAGGQLRRVRLDGGSVEAVTAWRGEIAGFRPLADGRTIALIAFDEPDAADERRRDEGDDAIVWSERGGPARLRLLDLDAGAMRVVADLGERHVVEVAQRPDGGPLAVLSWADPEEESGTFAAELHVVDPGTAEVRDLGPVGVEAGSPTWWRSGESWHLCHLAMTPPGLVAGTAVFDVTVPPAGPAGEHRNLTAGTDSCPTELVQVADGPPLALFADGLDTTLSRLDPQDAAFQPVMTRPGITHALTASHDGDVVAMLAGTAYEPEDVHAGPPAAPLTRVSDTRPQLRALRWGSQERLSYHAADGLRLDALLVLPPGKRCEDGPFPMVTLVHGGPYGRYADAFQFHGEMPPAQWLAMAGYAVFLPNPRGSQGRGHAFAAAVAGAVGGAEWTDITDGIDMLVAQGVADPDRLGIGGGSHGGFMAAWAVGQTDRFKAAVMLAGISDWSIQTAAGDQGAALEAALSGSTGWEGPGPHPHDRVSPVSYASRVRTPVLIIHGQEDTNVPVSQAVQFHRALRNFGVEHELVVYPREGHMINERAHRLDLLHRTRAWFDRWLAPRTQDPARH